MFTLRPDQERLDKAIHDMWGLGHRNVVAVAPTGFGKTVSASALVREKYALRWHVLIIAHRKELIEQWSLALAQFGVPHTFIAQESTISSARNRQQEVLGRCLYDAQSTVIISSVDTLVKKDIGRLKDTLDLWLIDESHHCLLSNKWGRCVDQFKNALGLGLTATPERADGLGIGRHAHGVFDTLVTGPSLRELITAVNLSDYEVIAPPNDVDLSGVNISKTTGDYTDKGLTVALDKSHVYGDVVQHYIEHAYGKLGVVFAVDVRACHRLADDFNRNNVPAVALSARNTNAERNEALRKLRAREYWVVINCDLFSEGFDLPAIEVMQDAQPTKSYARYAQKFGRALRIMPGNPGKVALILDHVGNVVEHKLPDHRKTWSLADRPKNERRSSVDVESEIRICGDCYHNYDGELSSCPFCGWRPSIESSSREIAQIEGRLVKLSEDQLQELRGQIAKVDRSPDEVREAMMRGGFSDKISYGRANQHRRQQEAQHTLRHTTALWAGLMRSLGMGEIEQELFLHRFGVNVLAAQTYRKVDAEKLTQQIRYEIKDYLQWQ